MSAVAEEKKIIKGGAFLIEERKPEEIFTPEELTNSRSTTGNWRASLSAKRLTSD